MAAPSDVASAALRDVDIVRYWRVFSATDADACARAAQTRGISFEFAQRFAGEPGSATHSGMLRHVEIDDATYDEAIAVPQHRRQVLANPYHAQRTQAVWPTLTDLERQMALSFNDGLDPEFIDAAAAAEGDPHGVAQNAATPTATLDRLVEDWPNSEGWSRILAHPNARRSWVDYHLTRNGRLAAAAARWPGLTEAELQELCTRSNHDGTDTPVAATARLVLTSPWEQLVHEMQYSAMDRALAAWLLEHLEDETSFTAATLLARTGFAGTVVELAEVAHTFQR